MPLVLATVYPGIELTPEQPNASDDLKVTVIDALWTPTETTSNTR